MTYKTKCFYPKFLIIVGESRKAFVEITDSVVGTAQNAVKKIPEYFKSAGKVISRSDELLSSAITILAVFIFKALSFTSNSRTSNSWLAKIKWN